MSPDELRQSLEESKRLDSELERLHAEWRRYKADHIRMSEELTGIYNELAQMVTDLKSAKLTMGELDVELRKLTRLLAENYRRLNEAVDEIEDDNWWKGDDPGNADSWKYGPAPE